MIISNLKITSYMIFIVFFIFLSSIFYSFSCFDSCNNKNSLKMVCCEPGARGPAGEKGEPGKQGEDGQDGEKGDPGEPGPSQFNCPTGQVGRTILGAFKIEYDPQPIDKKELIQLSCSGNGINNCDWEAIILACYSYSGPDINKPYRCSLSISFYDEFASIPTVIGNFVQRFSADEFSSRDTTFLITDNSFYLSIELPNSFFSHIARDFHFQASGCMEIDNTED